MPSPGRVYVLLEEKGPQAEFSTSDTGFYVSNFRGRALPLTTRFNLILPGVRLIFLSAIPLLHLGQVFSEGTCACAGIGVLLAILSACRIMFRSIDDRAGAVLGLFLFAAVLAMPAHSLLDLADVYT